MYFGDYSFFQKSFAEFNFAIVSWPKKTFAEYNFAIFGQNHNFSLFVEQRLLLKLSAEHGAYVVSCTISYHLYDLKNVKNIHGWVLP